MKECRLYDIAKVIRSKNSGPFQITLDVLFEDGEDSCGKTIGDILRRYTILQGAGDRMAERIMKAGLKNRFWYGLL